MDTFEIFWLVILIGAIAYYFFFENNNVVCILIIALLISYFTITDWACWINESTRSVKDCTEWYAKECYNAAKDRDADEFRDIMHNWNEWEETLNKSDRENMVKTWVTWCAEHNYKYSVVLDFETHIQ